MTLILLRSQGVHHNSAHKKGDRCVVFWKTAEVIFRHFVPPFPLLRSAPDLPEAHHIFSIFVRTGFYNCMRLWVPEVLCVCGSDSIVPSVVASHFSSQRMWEHAVTTKYDRIESGTPEFVAQKSLMALRKTGTDERR